LVESSRSTLPTEQTMSEVEEKPPQEVTEGSEPVVADDPLPDANELVAPSMPVVPAAGAPAEAGDEDDDDEEAGAVIEKKSGRRKINIEFIEDKSRRHITFSKRKAGIMKKAYELSALTGTQVLLLVASETGHVYTYATEKLQPLIQKPEGKNLIQTCLSAPDQVQALEGAADRPAKQRKVAGGGAIPAAMYGNHAAMAQAAQYARAMPYGALSQAGIPALQQGARPGMGFPGGLPGLPGMPGQGLPGMPNAAHLQGLSPVLIQGLMSGQLPSPAMMSMAGYGGPGSQVKLEALQQTISDAANAAQMAQHRDMYPS